MERIRFVAISAFLLLSLSLPARAQDAVERMDKGLINWGQGYVEASGSGAPPSNAPNMAVARISAERAAKVDALRNLLETVKGVRVDSETTVENFTTTSDTIRTRVEGIVKGAQQIDKKYLGDGAVEVTLRMPLTGDLSQVMLEQVVQKAPQPGQRVQGFSPYSGMGAGSYESVLKDLQRKREEEDRRRREADVELRQLEAERRAAEKARKEAEEARKQEEARFKKLKDDEERAAAEAVLAEKRKKEEEERQRLAQIEEERRQAEMEKEKAETEKKRLADLIEEQKRAQQTAAAKVPSEPVASAAAAPAGSAASGPPASASSAPAGGGGGAAAAGAVVPVKSSGGNTVTAMNAQDQKVDPAQAHGWTGLIIDARSLGLKPSLVPELLADDGTLVYGAKSVEFDDAVKKGLVGYARDVKAAIKHLRVTDDPILVKGVKAYGAKNSDVILHTGDAKVIGQTDTGNGYLKKSRVMIVYD
ncbi:MAG: LPP20 family lipoprotein [Bdellovibrionota bacterium]